MKTTGYIFWRGPFIFVFMLIHLRKSLCTFNRSPIETNLVDSESFETDLEDDLEKQKSLKYNQKTPYKGWSAWSHWSTCSRTCDSGVRYKLRRCLGGTCQGKSKNIELCNNLEICPLGTADFRKHQCAQQNGKFYRNTLYDEWTPVESTMEPCALLCRAKKYGFTVKFQPKVVDGTRCTNDSKDVCIDGKCVQVGCDNVLESNLKLDDCGVCGGDGSSCGRPMFEWKNTYQFSQCDKTCGADSWKVSVSICLNRKTGKSVAEKFCADKERPRPLIEKCPHTPCPAHWVVAPYGQCNASCGEGMQRRQVYCAEHYNTSDNRAEIRKMADSYCWRHKKPDETQRCNLMQCPLWEVSEWSECSATCGKGTQTRRAVCRHDKYHDFNADVCQQKNKPIERQMCTTGISCEEAERNRLADYERYRYVAAAPFTQWDEAGFDNRRGQLSHHPHWFPGQWGDCSTTCGPGVKNRKIECVVLQPITQNVMVWPAYECDGRPKPPEFEPCEVRECPHTLQSHEAPFALSQPSGVSSEESPKYRWDYGEFGPCSASCLGGTHSPALKCVNVRTGQEEAWSNCDARQRLANYTKECNLDPCPPRWDYGHWSDCSDSCGGGYMKRQVRCIREMSRSKTTANTIILEDRQCAEPKPVDLSVCNTKDCPAYWHKGDWESCSTTCGPGERRRLVACQQLIVGGETKVHDPPTRCPAADRPTAVEVCDFGACATSMPIPAEKNNKQNPMKNHKPLKEYPNMVTFPIPGQGTAREGLTVKLKCPVKNFDRSKNRWLKNGQTIKDDGLGAGKFVVTNFGGLKIKSLTIHDGGVYTCLNQNGQVVGNFTLATKPATENFRKHPNLKGNDVNSSPKIAGTQQKLHPGKPESQTNSNTADSGFVVDPQPSSSESDKDQSLFGNSNDNSLPNPNNYYETKIAASDQRDRFQSISSTNMSKSASVSLIDALRNYLATNNQADAYAALSRANSISAVKFQWVTGPWSQCSMTCTNTSTPTGMKFRPVHCKVDIERYAVYVSDDICIRSGARKLPEASLCGEDPCPLWVEGEWQECQASRCIRYRTAIQRREAFCAFPNGTTLNDSFCNTKDRPLLKNPCFNDACIAEWRTTNWSLCTKTCGDSGMQMRMLMCVWHGTRKPAGNSCSGEGRPAVIRSCKDNKPCPKSNDLPGLFKEMDQECEDSSKYCSVVKYLGKCTDTNYNKQCCITCNYLAARAK